MSHIYDTKGKKLKLVQLGIWSVVSFATVQNECQPNETRVLKIIKNAFVYSVQFQDRFHKEVCVFTVNDAT
jgi:hypothetical protein